MNNDKAPVNEILKVLKGKRKNEESLDRGSYSC